MPQVGVHYDPMIAKLITKGPDRQTALDNLHTALSELQVLPSILYSSLSQAHRSLASALIYSGALVTFQLCAPLQPKAPYDLLVGATRISNPFTAEMQRHICRLSST